MKVEHLIFAAKRGFAVGKELLKSLNLSQPLSYVPIGDVIRKI